MINQSLSHVTTELALKANVVETYSRGTIDDNLNNLRTATVSKLAFKYNMAQTFSSYEISDMFIQTFSTLNTGLDAKATAIDVYTKPDVDTIMQDILPGLKGDAGAAGSIGPTGPAGFKLQGVKGATGTVGPQGEDSTSYAWIAGSDQDFTWWIRGLLAYFLGLG